MNERIKDFEKKCWNNQTNHLDAEKFAELVRADEREACAQLCEELIAPDEYSDTELSMWDVTCIDCAFAIRARSET